VTSSNSLEVPADETAYPNLPSASGGLFRFRKILKLIPTQILDVIGGLCSGMKHRKRIAGGKLTGTESLLPSSGKLPVSKLGNDFGRHD